MLSVNEIFSSIYKSSSFEESIFLLKNNTNIKKQINDYDILYSNFIEKNVSYNNDTEIDQLDISFYNICFCLYYRDLLYNIEKINKNTKNIIFKILNKYLDKSLKMSNKIFLRLCRKLLINIDFLESYPPKEFIDNYQINSHINGIEYKNKFFYYVLISKTGALNLQTISEGVIGYSQIENLNFSRLFVGFKCIITDISPHNNAFRSPLNFFIHDLGHSSITIGRIQENNLKDIKKIYIKFINKDKFLLRVFIFTIWSSLFEHGPYNWKDILKKNVNYGIDINDSKYIIKYLLLYAPKDVKDMNFENVNIFYEKCVNKLLKWID